MSVASGEEVAPWDMTMRTPTTDPRPILRTALRPAGTAVLGYLDIIEAELKSGKAATVYLGRTRAGLATVKVECAP